MKPTSPETAHIPGLAARTLACAVIKQALVDQFPNAEPYIDLVVPKKATVLEGKGCAQRMVLATGPVSRLVRSSTHGGRFGRCDALVWRPPSLLPTFAQEGQARVRDCGQRDRALPAA